MVPITSPLGVFYSYATRDEGLQVQLQKHLALLQREGALSTWSFRKIEPGTRWERAIDANLESAHLILLLVSAEFIASDYCWNIEMKRALDRNRCGDATVVPIILRPCDWQSAPFGALQALRRGGKPVVQWRPRDTAWTDITTTLRRIAHGRSMASGAVEPTAVNLAKTIAGTKARVDAVLRRGHDGVRESVDAVFGEVRRLVRSIRRAAPDLRITARVTSDRCVVRMGYFGCTITFKRATRPTSAELLVYDGFPDERAAEDEELSSKRYTFHVRSDGAFGWQYGTSQFLSPAELADRAVQNVLRSYRRFELPA
jgi:hypothetical protein